MGVVFRCRNQPTRYMTATGAAKRAKRKANNINSFSMATSCRVSSCRFDTTQHPSGQVKSCGRRPNAKAVVSAMPVVMAKARARITAIFVMAISPLQASRDCQNRASTSVTAITFWSFSERKRPPNLSVLCHGGVAGNPNN